MQIDKPLESNTLKLELLYSDYGKIDIWNSGRQKYIGYFYEGIDGYYVFVSNKDNGGFWDSYFLDTISNMLREINKPWDDIINNDPDLNDDPIEDPFTHNHD